MVPVAQKRCVDRIDRCRLDRDGVRESERRAGRVERLNVERRAGAEFEWPEIDQRRIPVAEANERQSFRIVLRVRVGNDPGFAGDRGDRSGAIVQIGEEVVGSGRGGEIKSEAGRLRAAEFRPVDVARRDECWRKRPRLLLVDIGVLGPPTEGDIAVHQRDAVEGGEIGVVGHDFPGENQARRDRLAGRIERTSPDLVADGKEDVPEGPRLRDRLDVDPADREAAPRERRDGRIVLRELGLVVDEKFRSQHVDHGRSLRADGQR